MTDSRINSPLKPGWLAGARTAAIGRIEN